MGLHRICKDCKNDWNVSRIEPGGKQYICPTCEFKARLKARNGGKRA